MNFDFEKLFWIFQTMNILSIFCAFRNELEKQKQLEALKIEEAR